MRIGFVVNRVGTEQPAFTTTRLARAAVAAGHDAWLIGVEDFAHDPDEGVAARARAASVIGDSLEDFLGRIQDDEAAVERISVDDLDVLMMRNDPADDVVDRPWAVAAGVLFAQLAVARGVLVVNDPFGLANALNKTYFQHFPAAIRPLTLISRDPEEITDFVDARDGRAVLKPLQGSGGSGVFVISPDEAPNLQQIIEAIARDGYVVAQEFLPDAENGDVRVFVMNGEPLRCGGSYAAFRRVNEGPDPRSNMHVGGKGRAAELTPEMLELVRAARPKLIADGMFLVGLDVVGTKLMEVNVFSPGGLGTVEDLYGVRPADAVIEALAAKVARRGDEPSIDNRTLAVL
jgi:glutathione synthase